MFKPGTLVIGRDQSYRRSIYQVVSNVNQHAMVLKLICYGGRFGPADQPYGQRKISEFRKATKAEVKKEMGEAYANMLIDFVEKLLKRSYLGRRYSGW
jgi:hypothetical protein